MQSNINVREQCHQKGLSLTQLIPSKINEDMVWFYKTYH